MCIRDRWIRWTEKAWGSKTVARALGSAVKGFARHFGGAEYVAGVADSVVGVGLRLENRGRGGGSGDPAIRRQPDNVREEPIRGVQACNCCHFSHATAIIQGLNIYRYYLLSLDLNYHFY